ncbi:fibronectin type III domain-containing protein [Marinobacter pelagius]|uniref:fibronectin type III domain-containing protein n=1 Tax=Marinobacter sp. C7 TaxID=2951363 RepID=UPI001EF1547F|nr:fibronectin type III domain-containing protein [Marinobacter sp. C7]MCG7201531.1 fibronectin type III domain-containing protein [Marinobacter sp. C7]
MAAAFLGAVLTGCGGGSSSSETSSQGAFGDNGSKTVDGSKALLSWTAPSTRVNGDGLSMGELDRYIIRYGQDADNLTEQVVIGDAAEDATMSYTVGGLGQGTWYFSIQVQDSSGLTSPPSEVVSKSIQS